MPVEVTDSSFDEQVLNAPGPILVDFWAEWCGPCKQIAPSLEEIASEMDGKITIAKINDRNQETYRREERLLLSSMYEIGVRILDRNIQSTMRTPATETPTFLQNARAEQERRSSVSKPN